VHDLEMKPIERIFIDVLGYITVECSCGKAKIRTSKIAVYFEYKYTLKGEEQEKVN
jgi:hypothetical protein